MAKIPLLNTTVSDFGGGWNVADSPLNLASRFQPVSDNVLRGVNGSFTVRWGTELVADCRDGTETTTEPADAIATAVTENSPYVSLTLTGHSFADGDHITISDDVAIASGTLGTIPESALVGTFGVIKVDANTIKIATRYAATSTDTGTITMTSYTRDTHTLAGDIIAMQYFKQHLVLYDNIGEVAIMKESDGTVLRIWNAKAADTLSSGLAPTRSCDQVTTTTFKSTVISVNGYDNDKPLQIDDEFNVEFLLDKGTLTNTAVPRADIVVGMQGYVILLRTEYGDPFVEFSAKNTDGTFTRQTDPADAVEVDLSMVTDTVEPIILGAGPFRDKLFVAFYDRGIIGTIGVYSSDGTTHEPDFNDTIAENGTISNRTIVPLGNDVFMTDYAGVPALSISQASGERVPTRLSELVAPELQKHLKSLSEDTLRNKAFALFNKSDRMYMLFLPKCDETAQDLPRDPFRFSKDLNDLQRALVYAPGHHLFEGSYVTIAGASDIGTLTASTDINGKRKVVAVVDDNSFIIQLDGTMPVTSTLDGGGSSVTITPVNDETICYGFEYNRELKIRRWTRLRGLNFACGAVSQRGRVYFAREGRVFRYGSNEKPLYADNINGWEKQWDNSTDYAVGDLVLDTDESVTYKCLVAHTSASSGTFQSDRDDNPDNWHVYEGEPINWALETPWSSFSMRGNVKQLKYVDHDSEGEDEFKFSVFTDQIYRDRNTYENVPMRAMKFTAGGFGGFGIKTASVWGSGRRTREEKLWPMECRGKLFKLRYEGSTTKMVRIISTTLHYLKGGIR